jgi:sRNA-binding regulator protein Hfq
MKYTAEQLGDIESAYLRKQRDLKVPLTFTFLNGKEYTGVVLDFTPFTVHIMDSESGQEIILRKLAMAYYRKADAIAEARAAQAAAGGDNSARGED